MMLASISALLDAGSAAGQLRSDVSAADMLTSLAGIALATRAPGQRDVAERLMDLAMDALRARA
jgi:hypothetical protein